MEGNLVNTAIFITEKNPIFIHINTQRFVESSTAPWEKKNESLSQLPEHSINTFSYQEVPSCQPVKPPMQTKTFQASSDSVDWWQISRAIKFFPPKIRWLGMICRVRAEERITGMDLSNSIALLVLLLSGSHRPYDNMGSSLLFLLDDVTTD